LDLQLVLLQRGSDPVDELALLPRDIEEGRKIFSLLG
jgi:hypothetical protein